jgi:hypothetical protein
MADPNRTSYGQTLANASATKASAVAAANLAAQETINASGCNVGYNPNNATAAQFTTYNNAVIAAGQAKLLALYNAEVAKQLSLAQARETLQNSGDVNPR